MSKIRKSWLKMSGVNRIIFALTIVLGLALFPAFLYATTDTFDTPVNYGSTGTYPDCLTFHGNSSSTADALVVTLPDGFTPGYVKFHANSTATDQTQDWFEWYYGMGTSSGLGHLNGSPPVASSGYAITFSSTGNTITLPATMQTNSGAYYGRVCR